MAQTTTAPEPAKAWLDLAAQRQPRDFISRLLVKNSLNPLSLGVFGPKGVGKKTIVYQLVHHFLCSSDQGICNNCTSCQLFLQNAHPDFIAVRPTESLIRLSDIKEMQAKISLYPAFSSSKIVVIEDGEKLNLESSNALLKTLEEPLERVKIVLISNQEKKILPTIHSRLFKVYFPYLRSDEVRQILTDQEKFDPDLIETYLGYDLARVDQDWLANFEHLSFWDEHFTDIFLAYSENRSSKMVFLLEAVEKEGQQALFLQFLILWLRKVLTCLLVTPEQEPPADKASAEQLTKLAGLSLIGLFESVVVIENALLSLEFNAQKDLALEAAVLKMKKLALGAYSFG